MSNLNKFLQSFSEEIKEKQQKEELLNKKIEQENLFNNKECINEINNDKIKPKIKLNKTIKLNKINTNNESQNDEQLLSEQEKIFLENRKKDQIVKEQLEKDLIKSLESVNTPNNKVENNVSSHNSKIDLEKMFIESETPEEFRDKWFELYNKSLTSTNKTMTNNKIKNGRFRFNTEGELEILANFKTKGKSSNQLLHEIWKL